MASLILWENFTFRK